jgi:hypothetical protein
VIAASLRTSSLLGVTGSLPMRKQPGAEGSAPIGTLGGLASRFAGARLPDVDEVEIEPEHDVRPTATGQARS